MVAHSKAIDKQSLKGLSPLGKLTPDKIDDIVSKSRVENLPAGRIVFRQGEDDGQTIYLLSGQIELSTAGKTRKKTLKGKSVEAKFPIADKIPRPATVRTKTASSLLYIDSSLLEILLDENPSGEYEVTEIDIADHATDWILRFLQSRAFLKLPTKNIQKVLMCMEEVHVTKGNTIVQQGEEGDYYYIIKHGCCTVSRHPAEKAEEVRLATLVEGDGFGEEALIANCNRNATVTMLESGTLMRLKKDDFLNLLVTPLIRNVHLNSLKSTLYKNASILDIRTRDEFKKGSLEKAKHIPLSMMRLRIPTLDTSKQYLIYSDNSNSANAAVFLLAQHGIECMVILGSEQKTTKLSETAKENNKATTQNAKSPELKIISTGVARKQTKDLPSAEQQTSPQAPGKLEQEAEKLRGQAKNIVSKDSARKQTKDVPSAEQQTSPQAPDKLEQEAEKLRVQAKNTASKDSARKQTKDVPSAEQQTISQTPDKPDQEAEKLRLQAKKEAEQMLAEAKAIRLTAIQDASRLRDKIEKDETLKLRTELETTRNKAEAAIKKSEQLAERIRQQAEQESSQIRQQALDEAEKLQEELNQLRKHEAQMKQEMETELLVIQQQATEQVRLEAEKKAEQAKMAAEQAAEEVRILAAQEAEKARAIAKQEAQQTILAAEQARTIATKEAQQTILAAEQARTIAIREAEETRLAAEKTAVEAKAVADRLTLEAQTIEKQAEQARLKAEQEAEAIRQAARQEANQIKQDALEASIKIKNTAPVESKSFINHDNVFNFDDELSPTIEPVLPYADEASVALKMAEEIKARLLEVEEQQIKNEQLDLQKPVKYTAEVINLDGKIILESEKDIFVFKEPKKLPAEKLTIEHAPEQVSEEQSQQKHSTVHTGNAINELPSADIKPVVFNGLDLPTIKPDNNSFVDDEKPKRSILAIAASIILVLMLSLVAYTTKIEFNYSEVDALVNRDSIETEEENVKAQARKDFRKKVSSIAKK